jgi:hypothetical protein
VADTSITYNVFAKFHGDEGKMSKFGKTAAVVGAAVGALAVKFGVNSVHAYSEAQASQDKLAFALAKFPQLADTNIDRLGALNTAMAQKTKFDDDSIASGQAVLGQFVTNGAQLERLTPLLLDYAAKTGKDLPSAAAALGKASLGNTRALKELGINYKATGDQATDMANITSEMSQKVGGFAEKEGKSAAGQAAILQNQFGELEESVGAKLVPVLIKLAGVLLEVIGFVQRNSGVLGPLAAIVGTVALGIWAMTVAQGALNAVMALNPIALVVIAIAALAAGFIYAYKHSETFRNIVNGVMHAVQVGVGNGVAFIIDAFHGWLNMWLTVADAMISGAAKALGWIPGLGGKLRKANDAFDSWRAGLDATMDGLAASARGWGDNVATGLANGISASSYKAVAAAGTMANKVNAMANDQFKNHSPSKVAFQIGMFFSEGLALGIKGGATKAIEAVTSLTTKVIAKLQELRSKAASIRDSAAGAVRGMFNFGDIGAEGASPVAQFAAGATQAGAFAGATSTIAGNGLDPRIVAQAVGTGNLGVVQALAALDPASVSSVNRDFALAQKFAAQVGQTVLSTTPLPAQIAREEAMLTELRALKDALKNHKTVVDLEINGKKFAHAVARDIRDELDAMLSRRGE